MADRYGGWLGILKWSLAQQDGTHDSEFKEMGEEVSRLPLAEHADTCAVRADLNLLIAFNLQEKRWLEEAFASMTVDETKRMQELAQQLMADAPEGDEAARTTSRLEALDELSDLVETIDNAKNLFIVGGFGPLLACLDGPAGKKVQKRAAEVLSTVVQNNPKAQLWALQAGTLPALAELLPTSATTEASAATFGLSAAVCSCLSALVRDSRPGQRDLVVPSALLPRLVDVAMMAQAASSLQGMPQDDEAANVARAARRCLRKLLFFFRHLVFGAEAPRVLSTLCRTGEGQGQQQGQGHGEGHFLGLAAALLRAGSLADHGDDADLRDARENVLVILEALGRPAQPFAGVEDDTGDHRMPRGLFNRERQAGQQDTQAAGGVTILPMDSGPSEAPLLLTAGPADEVSGTTQAHSGHAHLPVPRHSHALAPAPAPASAVDLPMGDRERRAALRQCGMIELVRAHLQACRDGATANGGNDGEEQDAAALLSDEAALGRAALDALTLDSQR